MTPDIDSNTESTIVIPLKTNGIDPIMPRTNQNNIVITNPSVILISLSEPLESNQRNKPKANTIMKTNIYI